MQLFDNALSAYKKKHKITLTNLATRNTIGTMLKKMLISQYFTNINLASTLRSTIHKVIYYARGFLQIKDTNENIYREIKNHINKAFEDQLILLRDTLDKIPSEIYNMLPI